MQLGKAKPTFLGEKIQIPKFILILMDHASQVPGITHSTCMIVIITLKLLATRTEESSVRTMLKRKKCPMNEKSHLFKSNTNECMYGRSSNSSEKI